MSFLYPLGLLGLILIPVVIILYILKNRYQEKAMSSNYIWFLAEKYLKKKNPLHKISGLLSLILQILTIIVLSLSISHPIISVPNSAQNYLFIVDTSGSMLMEEEDQTRFEVALSKIRSMVSSTNSSSNYTLIEAGYETSLVCEKLNDKATFLEKLDTLEASSYEANLDQGLALAQEYFLEDSSFSLYLLTDHEYETYENIEVINVATSVDNYSLLSGSYSYIDDTLNVYGNVISYTNDVTLNLDLILDDEVIDSLDIDCLANEEITYTFNVAKAPTSFKKLEISIKNDDSLSQDNHYIIYNNDEENVFNTLIVSSSPFYIQRMVSSLSSGKVDTLAPTSYNSNISGYELYIFDGYSPSTLPSDGSIWLFNVSTNIPNAGFTIHSAITLQEAGTLSYTKANNSVYNQITNNIIGNKISISKYYSYSMYDNFTTILSYNDYPLVFAGNSYGGNREVVFAFDLHDSNLPLLLDYAILTNNLLQYSLPNPIDESLYTIGDVLTLNVVPLCQSISITYPSNKVSYLNISSSYVNVTLNEVGTYNISVVVDDEIKNYQIYAKFPAKEGQVIVKEESVIINGEQTKRLFDGTYDPLIIVIMMALVILALDWVVYCYEH